MKLPRAIFEAFNNALYNLQCRLRSYKIILVKHFIYIYKMHKISKNCIKKSGGQCRLHGREYFYVTTSMGGRSK